MADSRSTIKGLRARLDALGVPHGRISTGAALRVAIEEATKVADQTLDVKNMRIAELKAELSDRGIDHSGARLKVDYQRLLSDARKAESESEEDEQTIKYKRAAKRARTKKKLSSSDDDDAPRHAHRGQGDMRAAKRTDDDMQYRASRGQGHVRGAKRSTPMTFTSSDDEDMAVARRHSRNEVARHMAQMDRDLADEVARINRDWACRADGFGTEGSFIQKDMRRQTVVAAHIECSMATLANMEIGAAARERIEDELASIMAAVTRNIDVIAAAEDTDWKTAVHYEDMLARGDSKGLGSYDADRLALAQAATAKSKGSASRTDFYGGDGRLRGGGGGTRRHGGGAAKAYPRHSHGGAYRGADGAGGACYICGSTQHWAAHCPKARKKGRGVRFESESSSDSDAAPAARASHGGGSKKGKGKAAAASSKKAMAIKQGTARCFRCNKAGHFAAHCKAKAPASDSD